MTVNKLKEAVRQLSTQERILFVQYILDTISEDSSSDDAGQLSDEWKEELDSRSKAYKNDKSETKSWDDIKDRLLKKNR